MKYKVTDDDGAREQEERAKIVRDMRLKDLSTIVQTEEGRRWIYSVIERCHIFHPVMTGNSYTFFNDGMRQVGLLIVEELSCVDPELFGRMHAESFKWRTLTEEILHGKEEQ